MKNMCEKSAHKKVFFREKNHNKPKKDYRLRSSVWLQVFFYVGYFAWVAMRFVVISRKVICRYAL